MYKKKCGCRNKCHCHKSQPRRVVYPVREEVKNRYTEERVQHVHPSHTRVVNNHTIRNEHSYPHSTSYENRVNEVDVRGVSDRPGNGVGGAFDRPCHNRRPEMDCRHNCRHYNKHCHCYKRRRSWF